MGNFKFLFAIILLELKRIESIINYDNLGRLDDLITKPYKTYQFEHNQQEHLSTPYRLIHTSTTTLYNKISPNCPFLIITTNALAEDHCECDVNKSLIKCRNLNSYPPFFQVKRTNQTVDKHWTIDLKLNNFKKISNIIDLNVTKLVTFDLALNEIKFIDEQLMCVYDVHHFNASHNQLTTVHLNSYQFLYSLDLSFNLINKISYDEIHCHNRTAHLRHLNLSNNFIDKINLNRFAFKNSIELVDLSCNNLTFIDQDDLIDLKTLKHLNLNKNSIKQLNINTNEIIENLKHFHLSENFLTNLQNYTFGTMKNLLELDLSSNQIESVEVNAFMIHPYAHYGPGVLEKLDLSSNKLEFLHENTFKYLINLKYLKLSTNRLKQIHVSLFQFNMNMQTLDISNNFLKNLNFLHYKLKHLRYLKLTNNYINEIKNQNMASLKSIRTIDLSFNHIDTIDNCTLYFIHKTIYKFILNNNRLETFNSCFFQFNFKQIRFIQLLYNPLNCTNSCELLNAVYNQPYSINYYGNECKYFNSTFFCTNSDYDRINRNCKELHHYCVNMYNNHHRHQDSENVDDYTDGLSVGGSSDESYLMYGKKLKLLNQNGHHHYKSNTNCAIGVNLKILFTTIFMVIFINL